MSQKHKQNEIKVASNIVHFFRPLKDALWRLIHFVIFHLTLFLWLILKQNWLGLVSSKLMRILRIHP